MPLTRPAYVVAGAVCLLLVWVWPLPHLGIGAFSRHMIGHMVVVAIAAPLLAWGMAGGAWDPARRLPLVFAAIPAAMLEFVAVWAWHTPALHHAARHAPLAAFGEQGTFLMAGFWLWASAIGGSARQRRRRAVAGITGLLLTSMHMTLLGALIALTPRVLYAHAGPGHAHWSPQVDQQLGGAIMLLLGGVAYLAGGLGLTADALLQRADRGGGTA